MSNMYNGYANYETWNVCLWIANDEGLYNIAKECESYEHFKKFIREATTSNIRFETPDNVAWNDTGIELYQMKEFWDENFSTVEA